MVRKPTPPDPALDRVDLVAAVAELTDSEAAMIRAALTRRELAEFDAACNVAAKRGTRGR